MKKLTRTASATLARVVAALCFALFTLAPAAGARQTPPAEVRLTILTYNDLYNPVPGTIVDVDSGAAPCTVASDIHGAIQSISMQPGSVAVVTLEETTLREGTSLGQTHVLQVPSLTPGYDLHFLERMYHQPFALPILIDTSSSSERIAPSPHHSRWGITPVTNAASVRFRGQIAMLLTAEEIDAFAAYNNVQFGTAAEVYFLGLVIRAPAVDLGDHNLVLDIDCAGHGFSAMPVADCYSLLARDTTVQPAWSAQAFDWIDERTFLLLKGQLIKGDSIILLKSGGTQLPTAPLVSAPLPLALPGVPDAIIGGQDCIPECPGPGDGEGCAINAPHSQSGCYTAVEMSKSCGSSTGLIGPYVCVPGGTAHYKRERVRGGAVTVKLKLNSNVTTEATGHYEDLEAVEVDIPLSTGDGCGQCVGECRNVTVCVGEYKVAYHKYTWLWEPENSNWPFPYRHCEPCAYEAVESARCEVSGTSYISCNRVNCSQ